jgi:hypothetical protein
LRLHLSISHDNLALGKQILTKLAILPFAVAPRGSGEEPRTPWD